MYSQNDKQAHVPMNEYTVGNSITKSNTRQRTILYLANRNSLSPTRVVD